MEIKDEYILGLALILLMVTGLSLYTIFSFAPIADKCAPSFEIVNKCRCVPDNYLAKLLNVNQSWQINIKNITK